MKNSIYILVSLFVCFTQLSAKNSKENLEPQFELVSIHPQPVIGRHVPDAKDVKFGFEGGSVRKIHGVYYLSTTECFDEPKTAAVRIALWKSLDGTHFKRVCIMDKTNYNWNDTTYRMSPWAPILTYDSANERWSVFHVGYKRKPYSTDVFNMSGKIARQDSKVKGMRGIEGPYSEVHWIDVDNNPDAWESTNGMLGFYPFQVKNQWYAFFCCNGVPIDNNPRSADSLRVANKIAFQTGLVKSSRLNGHWERCSSINPVPFDPEFIENPVVTRLKNGCYIALYDGNNDHALPYTWSYDGVHWAKRRLLQLDNVPSWLYHIRTPLSLIEEKDGTYTVYFTAFDGLNPEGILPLWHVGYGNVGKMSVRIKFK